MTNADTPSFAQVLAEERAHILAARAAHGLPPNERDAAQANLVGLAFSGGGIRSATFCLGVLQSLAARRLLKDVDYLSTVSGGGYIGAWLGACIHHRGYARTLAELAQTNTDSAPLTHLRRFSNYLTPRVGLTSIDFWTAISIYLRNTLLNQSMLAALLVLGILVPWAVAAGHHCEATNPHCLSPAASSNLALYGGLGLYTVIGLWSVLNATRHARARRARMRAPAEPEARMRAPAESSARAPTDSPVRAEWHAALAMALALVAGVSLATWLAGLREPLLHSDAWLLGGTGVGAAFGLCSWLIVMQRTGWAHWRRRFGFGLGIACAATLCGALLGAELFAIAHALHWQARALPASWMVPGIGGPLVAAAIGVSVVLFFGLVGRAFGEWVREWQARFGAWLLVHGLVWSGAFVLVFVAPPVLTSLGQWASGGFATWIGTALGGALLGNAKATDGGGSWRDTLLKVVPFVFVIGLSCAVAWWVFQALALLTATASFGDVACGGVMSFNARLACHEGVLAEVGAPALWLSALPALALLAIGGSRFDVNLFSLHELYRNRLARCYIGASRGDRRPNPISGFDSDDDIALPALAYTREAPDAAPVPSRPLHVFNAALNLTRGEELAWQERMGASFWITPLNAGYGTAGSPLPETIARVTLRDADGAIVQPVDAVARDLGGRVTASAGLELSTAMAISGAAASPNMGYHTSPPVAFLMAMFNLRLGWWLANPKMPSTWRRASPLFSAGYLMRELIGRADHRSGFVHLSDGGHFDNMGLYELVRRRARYILLVDAEEDADFGFAGVSDAIRKCRIDFGARFEIDFASMRGEAGTLASQIAAGRITYRANEDDPPWLPREATLLYLKAGIVPGDVLAADVRGYADAHPTFPHESTADQWFAESQFESYRALGFTIAEKALHDAQQHGAATLADVIGMHVGA